MHGEPWGRWLKPSFQILLDHWNWRSLLFYDIIFSSEELTAKLKAWPPTQLLPTWKLWDGQTQDSRLKQIQQNVAKRISLPSSRHGASWMLWGAGDSSCFQNDSGTIDSVAVLWYIMISYVDILCWYMLISYAILWCQRVLDSRRSWGAAETQVQIGGDRFIIFLHHKLHHVALSFCWFYDQLMTLFHSWFTWFTWSLPDGFTWLLTTPWIFHLRVDLMPSAWAIFALCGHLRLIADLSCERWLSDATRHR